MVRLLNVSSEAEDWLSSYAFDCEAAGISEELQFRPKPGTDEVESIFSEKKSLQVYFSDPPTPLFLEEIRVRYPEIQILVEAKENEDWMEGWKKHFQAFEIVEGYWVVPSWLPKPKQAKKILEVDPGMAFGTGTHETTSMMAQALFSTFSQSSFNSVIDVGTGTGILAILARYLGCERVVATDTDPESQRVARENFDLNHVSIQMDERQIDQLKETFQVVLANIIEGVLVQIKTELFEKLKPHGFLILSGILKDNEADFKKDFQLPANFEWVSRLEKGEWLCLVAQHQSEKS